MRTAYPPYNNTETEQQQQENEQGPAEEAPETPMGAAEAMAANVMLHTGKGRPGVAFTNLDMEPSSLLAKGMCRDPTAVNLRNHFQQGGGRKLVLGPSAAVCGMPGAQNGVHNNAAHAQPSSSLYKLVSPFALDDELDAAKGVPKLTKDGHGQQQENDEGEQGELPSTSVMVKVPVGQAEHQRPPTVPVLRTPWCTDEQKNAAGTRSPPQDVAVDGWQQQQQQQYYGGLRVLNRVQDSELTKYNMQLPLEPPKRQLNQKMRAGNLLEDLKPAGTAAEKPWGGIQRVDKSSHYHQPKPAPTHADMAYTPYNHPHHGHHPPPLHPAYATKHSANGWEGGPQKSDDMQMHGMMIGGPAAHGTVGNGMGVVLNTSAGYGSGGHHGGYHSSYQHHSNGWAGSNGMVPGGQVEPEPPKASKHLAKGLCVDPTEVNLMGYFGKGKKKVDAPWAYTSQITNAEIFGKPPPRPQTAAAATSAVCAPPPTAVRPSFYSRGSSSMSKDAAIPGLRAPSKSFNYKPVKIYPHTNGRK
ncbi:unnamed protein product [Vitrella brassicaformis CCMP3155]|uniref:Uncharacterized protein n=1 Tax=Vitrella brassicaformis (strain CCMP3155) TaxID=1169540 RepID=A0A0G4ETK9_VITBC|nr:unnamed protein product [Vitrella brassicaformis CCMP3155]|eukprot:CEM01779.1 unnamed protein product [Vitrella brassicaformis CCMP3155]